MNDPRGVAIDPAAGRIYWANAGAGKISFASLDGSGGGGDLSTTGATMSSPISVAVDPSAGRIYWANPAPTNKISFANLDGSGGGGDVTTTGANVDNPQGVALDPAARRIYWSNVYGNKISYANLDGSGGADLSTTGATMHNPLGVAVDASAGRIYWGNALSTKIAFARLDGSGGGGDLTTTGATANGPDFPTLLKAPTAAGPPAITGGAAKGSVLSCSNGSWAADLAPSFLFRAPGGFAYSWSRDGTSVSGATASSLTASAAGDYRCTVTASNAAGSASQTSGAHTVVAPPTVVLSGYRIKPGSFFAAGSGPSARASKRAKPGAKVRFRLNEAASVAFKVGRKLPGRKGTHGRCVKPTHKNRKKGRCTRLVKLPGGFKRAGHAGVNRFRFTGRLRGRKLAPRRYLLLATPTANGKSGKRRTARFRVKRPPHRRAKTHASH